MTIEDMQAELAKAEAEYVMNDDKAISFLETWATLDEFDFIDKMVMKHAIERIRDHARLVERNRILEDVRKHYADGEHWLDGNYNGEPDRPILYWDGVSQCEHDDVKNGFAYARQAGEQLEDLNGK